MSGYRKCAVRGCQGSVLVWHRFPNPTKFMYAFVQWVDCIDFTEEDNYGNNRLRMDAVPSLNLPDQQISNTTDEILGKPSTSASSQQLGEVCSVTTSQPENLDVTAVEPIEEHYSEASSSRTESGLLHKVHVTRETLNSQAANLNSRLIESTIHKYDNSSIWVIITKSILFH
ncbi:unnamed protein product [Acanthoscelides obtectus]|uniref:THAP-type domain-containing protein n=1 Tax=Acanthoscelides obtectus TaxID=200917 RepID=A0A9P0MDN3_ACAOB|nr:unnamed protein product [Acanthoscelides obtectus]CAK1633383.1 hypothetical protein AOBTE_LOCUS8092 [Acanthoscelides obtectus]